MVKHLQTAKKNKNDEFYTRKEDIEKELYHYKKHFKNKVIYCNCDDPKWSEFFLYFKRNFRHLGIKKVITTHFKKEGTSFMLEIAGGGVVKRKNLKSNGDFRSLEAIKLLKEADIVITNPPFSLWREYIAQLIKYNKKFLIIGNLNVISYKEIFPLIKKNKMWLGMHALKAFKLDKNNENNLKKFGNVRWFTNLEHNKRKEKFYLCEKYSPEKYPHYENYNAINVNKTVEIPMNYFDEIGVPITFLEKYNPNQFNIITLGIVGTCKFINNRKMIELKTGKIVRNGKGTLYTKHKKGDKKPVFKDYETHQLYNSHYARVIIKRK